MRYLVLSDIHSNWEALQDVLRDAEGLYEEICCLGDIVGYGADPNPVIEWVRENVPQVIRGNHDKACCGLDDLTLFNPVARAAAEWTLRVLTPDNRDYLSSLTKGPMEVNGFLMVHGSILDEDEYLIDPDDALPQFEQAGGRLVFFGHTHIQGGFLRWETGQRSEMSESNLRGKRLRFVEGRGHLLNPGSVGQPRDSQWQAGYALYDSDDKVVEFRRCPYDIAAAQRKIRDAGLPGALADRLAQGR